MVGTDVDNGLWAIYGARQGLYKTMCTDWNYVQVRDFKYLNELWREYESYNHDEILTRCMDIGKEIKTKLELPICENPLMPAQNKFFKAVYRNPDRISHAIIDPE